MRRVRPAYPVCQCIRAGQREIKSARLFSSIESMFARSLTYLRTRARERKASQCASTSNQINQTRGKNMPKNRIETNKWEKYAPVPSSQATPYLPAGPLCRARPEYPPGLPVPCSPEGPEDLHGSWLDIYVSCSSRVNFAWVVW